MAQTANKRIKSGIWLTNGFVAWFLGTDTIANYLHTGIYSCPEGWEIVEGKQPESWEIGTIGEFRIKDNIDG